MGRSNVKRMARSAIPSLRQQLLPGDVRDVWLATLRSHWKSLALVPASPGGSVVELGRALSELGTLMRGRPVPLMSAVDLSLGTLAQFTEALSRQAGKAIGATSDEDQRVIVAISSVVSEPLGVAVALACDAILLVIELGKSDIESARKTVEVIGAERFIGSLTIGKH